MNRKEEIEFRIAEIRTEMDNEGADIDALTKEVRDLKSEMAKIDEAAEKRKALREAVNGGAGAVMRSFAAPKSEERSFSVDSQEYRNAYLKNLQGKALDAEERTAIAASAVIPTQTMNKIIGKLELVPMISAVDVTYIPGNVTYPVEGTTNAASWVAMGTAVTDSADTLTSVSLSAYKLIKTIEVNADVKAMAIDAFETWLVERLSNKLQVAVDAAILTGAGTNQATGLLKSGEITQTGTFTKAAMKYKDLMGIIATVPAQYLPGASFVMPRALFYGEVLGMEDTSGNRVVVADAQAPAKFNILGYPVIVDDNCNADTVIFGDLHECYKFNFAQAPDVRADESVGFRTGSTVYRVMALADGKPVNKAAVCVFTRATA